MVNGVGEHGFRLYVRLEFVIADRFANENINYSKSYGVDQFDYTLCSKSMTSLGFGPHTSGT